MYTITKNSHTLHTIYLCITALFIFYNTTLHHCPYSIFTIPMLPYAVDHVSTKIIINKLIFYACTTIIYNIIMMISFSIVFSSFFKRPKTVFIFFSEVRFLCSVCTLRLESLSARTVPTRPCCSTVLTLRGKL